ncbi:hypothetical protein LSUE1_G002691 [Lachnellula suecica]|uniref:Calcineurin-like phosphoesterase domain-containing protein n=1 Tax=Lachnellula suecica TaxID=602035 RepID=A0A8T9CJV3_9HELO|nr:hypothetical protein LSUE1_G002691 [Lachnellula suecica]
MSDLHLEGSQYDYDIPRRAPYLVLAGDIGNAIRSQDIDRYEYFLGKLCARFLAVFVVLGNNEPKGSAGAPDGWTKAVKELRKMEAKSVMEGRLHFLDNNHFNFAEYNVTIMGCTLWSRLRRDQPRAAGGDRASIKGWTMETNNANFERSYRWIKNTVPRVRGDAKHRIVVITHHPPCFGTSEATHEQSDRWSGYKTDILGGEGVEGLRNGDVWIHGHTHFNADIMQDQVRVYSNQKGRRAEDNPTGSIPYHVEDVILV